MSKVALVYSGLLRTWERCRWSHKEYLDHDDNPDLDFWFYTDERPKVFDGISERVHFTQDQHVRWYPDPFKEHRYHERKAPENTYYQTMRQWRANYLAFSLVPQGYDIYVRIRPDIEFNGGINFKDYDCSGKTIYIPQGLDYGGVNDQFAFGNYEVMKIYYSVFENVHELFHEGKVFHSEGMQLANLQKHGVNIVRYPHPQVNIVR